MFDYKIWRNSSVSYNKPPLQEDEYMNEILCLKQSIAGLEKQLAYYKDQNARLQDKFREYESGKSESEINEYEIMDYEINEYEIMDYEFDIEGNDVYSIEYDYANKKILIYYYNNKGESSDWFCLTSMEQYHNMLERFRKKIK